MMMKWLWFLYVILIPSFYFVGKELRFSQEQFFRVAVSIILFCSFIIPHKKNVLKFDKFNLWLGIFGLWTVFIFMLGDFSRGTNILTNVCYAILAYYLYITTMTKEDTLFVFKGLCVSAGLNGLMMLSQQLGYDPIFSYNAGNDFSETVSFFGIKAHVGMYFALIITPILIVLWNIKHVSRADKVIRFFRLYSVLALYGWILFMTRSTGAVLAGIASLQFYLWYAKRKLFWILLVPIILAGSFYVVKIDSPMGMMNTRPGMWKTVVKNALKMQWTGFGLDSFVCGPIRYYMEPDTHKTFAVPRISIDEAQLVYQMPDNKRYDFWDNAHCEYIHTLYEMGIPSLVIIGMILYYMRKMFNNSKKTLVMCAVTGSILGLLIMSLCQFPFHIARIAHLIPLLLAIFYMEGTDLNATS